VFKDTFLLSVLLGLDDISARPFSFSGLFTIFIKIRIMENKEWKLQSLAINFKSGWAHEKTVDRYEGKISFSNGEGESFTFNVDQFQSQKFLDIVGEEIVKTASSLGDKVAKSIFLQPQEDSDGKEAH
jgi:hypothetical protein